MLYNSKTLALLTLIEQLHKKFKGLRAQSTLILKAEAFKIRSEFQVRHNLNYKSDHLFYGKYLDCPLFMKYLDYPSQLSSLHLTMFLTQYLDE